MSTATNKRARNAELKRIRLAITKEYHALSTVICDDRIAGKPIPADAGKGELEVAFDHLSDAINCINRETGRKENSNALGDGSE